MTSASTAKFDHNFNYNFYHNWAWHSSAPACLLFTPSFRNLSDFICFLIHSFICIVCFHQIAAWTFDHGLVRILEKTSSVGSVTLRDSSYAKLTAKLIRCLRIGQGTLIQFGASGQIWKLGWGHRTKFKEQNSIWGGGPHIPSWWGEQLGLGHSTSL